MIYIKEIVIINGSGGCGKDTFCLMCNDYAPCKVVSTVDKVKEAYKILGWDGEKREDDRLGLSDLKEFSIIKFDHPYEYIKKQIEEFRNDDTYEILFIHSREPEEIERFVKDFDCKTLLIKRSSVKKILSNHSDSDVENYDYDYVVDNSGTFEDLKGSAFTFTLLLRR